MAIEMVRVRAAVVLGGVTINTPYVLSFTVRKARNQVGTFDLSVKMNAGSGGGYSSGNVSISAGEGSATNTIFTGFVTSMSIAPCWDDPEYVIVNASGEDVSSTLRGKTFSRRCRGTKSSWVTIEGVVRQGLRGGKWSYESGTLSISPDMMITDNKTSNTRSPLASGSTIPTNSVSASIGVGFGYNAKFTEEVNL